MEVGQPGRKSGRARSQPGRELGQAGSPRSSSPLIIVQQPVAMAVDVDVANLVSQPSTHQIEGDVRSGIGDPGSGGAGTDFQVLPAAVEITEPGINQEPRVCADGPGIERRQAE